jgi:hypothetical protein
MVTSMSESIGMADQKEEDSIFGRMVAYMKVTFLMGLNMVMADGNSIWISTATSMKVNM